MSCKPVVGQWYMNVIGQLVKVLVVTYQSGELQSVIIEYQGGENQCVDAGRWDELELNAYFYHAVYRGRGKNLYH